MADAAVDTAVEHKRATVRPDKGDAVAALTRSFTESAAAVLTEYRGLTVKQLSDLRRALGADTTYAVVKNTLTKIAARDAGLAGLDELLSGPTAVAFVGGDPVAAAKGLRDYARANPALVVKGGVMDGRAMTADEIRRLADLESREVLLAKLAGAMKGSLSQAVSLFAAPLAQAARALGALEVKAKADPGVLGGGAGTPAAGQEPAAVEESPADEPTVEESPADESPVAELADQPLAAAGAGEAPAASTESTETSDTTDGTETTKSTDSTDSTDA